MRPVGRLLFDKPRFREACLESLNRSVRDAVFALVLSQPNASRSQLRQIASEAAILLSPVLSEAGVAVQSARTSHGQVKLTCDIPFTGDPAFFSFYPPMWPPPRPVRGRVRPDWLVLSAEGWAGEQEWLSTVLASELAEVNRILAAQEAMLRRWDREMVSLARRMVKKVRTDRELFDEMRSFTFATQARNPLAQLGRGFLSRMQQDIWDRWMKG